MNQPKLRNGDITWRSLFKKKNHFNRTPLESLRAAKVYHSEKDLQGMLKILGNRDLCRLLTIHNGYLQTSAI